MNYYFITYEVSNYKGIWKDNALIDMHPWIYREKQQSIRDQTEKEGKTVIILFYAKLTEAEYKNLLSV